MGKRLLLLSNLLENSRIEKFIEVAKNKLSEIDFLVTGDLLNIFPEPGEDLQGSIFQEIFGGDLLCSELEALVRVHFDRIQDSKLIAPLQSMFTPTGKYFAQARKIALQRYRKLFCSLSSVLGSSQLYFIPGNMDYPDLALRLANEFPQISMIDQMVQTFGAFTFGALGGIPNSAHPFRHVVEISPYEMSEDEYRRRLRLYQGVDVLLTHLSPSEWPELSTFMEKTHLKALICRAPFNFRKEGDFRGKMEIKHQSQGLVISIRPFEVPVNQGFLLDLSGPQLTTDQIQVVEF